MRRVQAVVLAWAVTFAASALANVFNVSVQSKVPLGKGEPRLEVDILQPITRYELVLDRSDGEKVRLEGKAKPGRKLFPLRQPEGTFTYKGHFSVVTPDGETLTLPLEFETQVFGALKMTLKLEDVDVKARTARFTLSRPAQKAQVKVTLDDGSVASEEEVAFRGEPAGTPLTVTWPATGGRILHIDVKAFDTAGFYASAELSPWRIDIPHEEVHFPSGSAALQPEELPKLDASAAQILDAVNRYGRLVEVKLYVAGHTDTVGSTNDNARLSLARAKAIAAYLRKRGVRVPVFYAGLGESALAVGTADEKDEPRNRRAEYILAVHDPALRNAKVRPSWKKL